MYVYRSCWIRWSRAPFSFKASVLVCGIWLTAPFANGPIVWWQRSEITEKLFTTVTIILRHSPSWFFFSFFLFSFGLWLDMYKDWWMDLFHHRPDNMENNVYEMWIHATRLRDPGRVQPVIKSRDPPLSKVTLRTRKRLCRGNVSLFFLIPIFSRHCYLFWLAETTHPHTMLDLISIMTNTTK